MQDIFGKVDNPLQTINPAGYAGLEDGGFISFLSNVTRVIIIAGGIWGFLNLLLAGFGFITAGGVAENISAAWRKIYMSLTGLVIMVASYAIAAIIGLLLFGDAGAILNPQIYGPGV